MESELSNLSMIPIQMRTQYRFFIFFFLSSAFVNVPSYVRVHRSQCSNSDNKQRWLTWEIKCFYERYNQPTRTLLYKKNSIYLFIPKSFRSNVFNDRTEIEVEHKLNSCHEISWRGNESFQRQRTNSYVNT